MTGGYLSALRLLAKLVSKSYNELIFIHPNCSHENPIADIGMSSKKNEYHIHSYKKSQQILSKSKSIQRPASSSSYQQYSKLQRETARLLLLVGLAPAQCQYPCPFSSSAYFVSIPILTILSVTYSHQCFFFSDIFSNVRPRPT